VANTVVRYSRTDEILHRSLINRIACPKVDGSTRLCLKAGVKEALRITDGGTLKEIELEMVLKHAEADD